jgi:hypothetical protein
MRECLRVRHGAQGHLDYRVERVVVYALRRIVVTAELKEGSLQVWRVMR